MKKALILTESTVYCDKGKFVAQGGGEMSMHLLAKGLLSLGLEVKVLGIREYAVQKQSERIEGVDYCRFNVRSRTSFKLWSYLRSAIVESKNHDVVFVNQFTPHLVLRNLSGKRVAVVHDIYGSLKFWIDTYGLFRGVLGCFIERLQISMDNKYADRIMAVSSYGKQRLGKFLSKTSIDKVFVNSWPVVERVDEERARDIILFVGRFVSYKNPDQAVRAFAEIKKRHANLKMVMVCSRKEKAVMKMVRGLLEDLSLCSDEVEIVEGCDQERLRAYYARAKVLLHPSEVEGLGLVCLEALACGVPVVAYDLPAYSGMLRDGETGFLVKKGMVGDFVKASVEALEKSWLVKLPESFKRERFLERLRVVVFE